MKFEVSYLDCSILAPAKTHKYIVEARTSAAAESQFYARKEWAKSRLLLNITEV